MALEQTDIVAIESIASSSFVSNTIFINLPRDDRNVTVIGYEFKYHW